MCRTGRWSVCLALLNEEREVNPQMAKEPLVGAGRRADLQAEDLYRLAVTDPLTGCYNRRFFYEVIERELERHRRHGIPLSLLFIDINHFKNVNDSLGHEAGDLVLQSVASLPTRSGSAGPARRSWKWITRLKSRFATILFS